MDVMILDFVLIFFSPFYVFFVFLFTFVFIDSVVIIPFFCIYLSRLVDGV